MNPPQLALPTPTGPARALAAGWLALALYSLVGAGLVVILIILARTPLVSDLIPWTGSFKTALVIHVDLSVLVWFLSFAGVLASLSLKGEKPALGRLALVLAALGALTITFSPFLGRDAPFMNNYVPILENNAFFVGLGLFLTGSLFMAVHGLVSANVAGRPQQMDGALAFGVKTALAIFLLTALVWVWTYRLIPDQMAIIPDERQTYYEVLYWGAGHLLQFTHTQLMMVAWLWLAAACGALPNPRPGWIFWLFVIGALPTLLGPVHHLHYGVETAENRLAFTQLMRHGNGLAAIPLSLFLTWSLWRHRAVVIAEGRPLRLALIMSLILFYAGGTIGFLIQGIDVTIPSHYHGSIVAITVAYMGLAYHLLPRLGYRRPNLKWSARQPILYGGGSLLHVAGLVLAGLYGIQRKTHGAAQELDTLPKKLTMALTGAGGMIAVTGGILFLVLAIRAFRKPAAD